MTILVQLKPPLASVAHMLSNDATSLVPPSPHSLPFSVFLDFDGTLVDIVERPESVVVNQRLRDLLRRLQVTLDHRLAIVSGRSIAQLDWFFGTTAKGLTLVGSHGAEIRKGGDTLISPIRPKALEDAQVFFEQAFAGHPNVVIEVKSLGVAIHYRLKPSVEEIATKMAVEFANRSGLELQHGKMMVDEQILSCTRFSLNLL